MSVTVENLWPDKRFQRHTFFLVAPALNFYRYPLLEVEHSATQLYAAKNQGRLAGQTSGAEFRGIGG
jgi:hypothetical protein